MNTFKPYESYKDSGVEWLGEIPSHWEIKRIKDKFQGKGGVGFPVDEQGLESGEVPFYKVSDTNNEGNEVYLKKANNYISNDSELAKNKTPESSIIFPKVGEVLKSNKRRISSEECIIDNNMMSLSPKSDVVVKFFYYVSLFIDLNKYSNPGAVPSVSFSNISDIGMPTPPLSEQRTIAAFLDDKTAKIDAALTELERQRELIEEMKRVRIHELVTSSGILQTVRFKDVFNLVIGKAIKNDELSDLETPFRYLPMSAIQGVRGDPLYINEVEDDMVFKDEKEIVMGHYGFNYADEGGTIGLFTDFDRISGYIDSNFIKLKNTSENISEYLLYAVQQHGVLDQIKQSTRGTIAKFIGRGKPFIKFSIISNKLEQEKVALIIRSECDRAIRSIKEIDHKITTLKEYRKTLIHEAVTGILKIN
jgi:type I restriction enzyme S subunit